MSLKYFPIDECTFRLSYEPNKWDIIDDSFYISECSDPMCIYSRDNTDIRERFERKIYQFVFDKKKIKILFYASCMLYQEFKIIGLIRNKISEVHLTDFVYKNMAIDNYKLAFTQFMQYININKLEINVFLHTDPDKLKWNPLFTRTFDAICGIDIDYTYGCSNNRAIIKDIAANTLNTNGTLFVSQHYTDLVDICQYQIGNDGTLMLKLAEDYVKPPYYAKYSFENMMTKIYYPFILVSLCLIINNFKESSIITTVGLIYFFVSILSRCFWENFSCRRINNLMHTIKKLPKKL